MDGTQVKAVLLHELAHIRRYDYLVNMLQAIVCSLLFYHPVVWWLDRRTRHLRECCCDEMALDVFKDRGTYASALERIASAGVEATHGLALAAKGGSVIARMRYLFGLSPASMPSLRCMTGVGLFFILTLALIGVMQFSTSLEASDKQPLRTLSNVNGRVLNPAGEPINGASVALYHLKYFYGIENRVIEEVVTDATGHFEFETELSFFRQGDERIRDAYTVVAWAKEGSLAWHEIDKYADRDQRLELQIAAPVLRTIRVVDAEGVGISGAEVYVHSIREGTMSALFTGGFGPTLALTDDDGNAQFSQLPGSSLNFAANMDGYSGSWTGCGAADSGAEICLYPGATVEGVVQDELGQPVVGTMVYAMPEWSLHDYVYAQTDTEGRFKIAGLYGEGGAWNDGGGTGEYSICLEDDHYQAAALIVKLKQGATSDGHVIAAKGAAIISGVLRDPATDVVVPFAKLSVQTAGGKSQIETDAEGKFSFPAPEGKARVGFWQPPKGYYVVEGHVDRSRPHWVEREVGRQDVSLALYAPSTLGTFVQCSGRVLMPDGSPAEGVTLSARLKRERLSLEWEGNRMRGLPLVTTDSEGRFVFENYPTGYEFDCWMSHKKKPFGVLVQLPEVDTKVTDLGDFQLERTIKREIQVVDLAGSPVADQSIYYGPYTGASLERSASVPSVARARLYSGTTDKSGKLVLGGCIPGLPYDLWLGKERNTWKRILHEAMQSDEPLQVTLDSRLRVSIVSLEGQRLTVSEVTHGGFSSRQMANRWNAIPILKQQDEGIFIISKESYQFNSAGSDIKMWCRLSDGRIVQAQGTFPERGSFLQLNVLEPLVAEPTFDVSSELDLGSADLALFVVDPTGQPIEGVSVIADPLGGAYQALSGMTNQEGICIFKNARKHIIYCELLKEGLAPQWQANLPMGEVIPVIMSEGANVAGQFRELEVGATGVVKLRMEVGRSKQWADGRQDVVEGIPYIVETDAEGRYSFQIMPGKYTVFAESEGGGFLAIDEWAVESSGAQLPQTLSAGVETEIYLRDSQTGEPIAGVPITVSEDISPYHTGTKKGSQRVSDETGRVSWKNLVPGMVRFDARSMSPSTIGEQVPYCRWWSLDHAFEFSRENAAKYNKQAPRGRDGVDSMAFTLGGADASFVVTMERGAHISGKVLLPENRPKGGIHVMVVPVRDQRSSLYGDSRDYIRVDPKDGSFSAWVPAGNGLRYRVCAYFRQYGAAPMSEYLPAAVSEPFESVPGEAFTFELSMLGGGWLTGRVVDERGVPCSGVGIQALPLDNASGVNAEPTAVTDAQGRYLIGPIRVTEYVVRIDEAPGLNLDLGVIAKTHATVVDGATEHIEDLIYKKE